MTNHSVPLWKIRPLPLLGGSLASSTIEKSLPFVHGKKGAVENVSAQLGAPDNNEHRATLAFGQRNVVELVPRLIGRARALSFTR